MAKSQRNLRPLKGGKVSIKLTGKIKETLKDIVEFRINTLSGVDELRVIILGEVYKKLAICDGRIKLSKHEFFCLFEESAFNDIPETVKTFVFASINPDLEPIELK